MIFLKLTICDIEDKDNDGEDVYIWTKNIAFYRNAIVLAARSPAVPQGGDAAVERRLFTDPHSGMTFEFTRWVGDRKVKFQVSAAWGVKVTQPRHTALLLG